MQWHKASESFGPQAEFLTQRKDKKEKKIFVDDDYEIEGGKENYGRSLRNLSKRTQAEKFALLETPE